MASKSNWGLASIKIKTVCFTTPKDSFIIHSAVNTVITGSAQVQCKYFTKRAAIITPTEDKVSEAICKKVALMFKLSCDPCNINNIENKLASNPIIETTNIKPPLICCGCPKRLILSITKTKVIAIKIAAFTNAAKISAR